MRRQLGLTLMEMLLTLMLSALAITLSLQVLGQYQRAQASAIRNERAGREYALGESWLRDSIAGLVAQPGEAFTGDGEGWSGSTMSPVIIQPGIPTPQRWQVSSDGEGRFWLSLQEGEHELALPVRPASRLRFHYLCREGELHESWPIEGDDATQLPAAVLLEIDDGDRRPRLIMAAVAASLDTTDIPFEFDQNW